MRHLVTVALGVGALVAYVLGLGPFFFGTPIVGGLLLLCAVVLELSFWLRLWRGRSSSETAPLR